MIWQRITCTWRFSTLEFKLEKIIGIKKPAGKVNNWEFLWMKIFVTISFHKLSTSCSKNAYRCSPSRQVQGLKMDQTKGFRYYWNHVLSYVENSTLIWAKRNLESLRCKSLVPENYLKNISKGDLVEETLMYNSQHTSKFEFSRPELRVRLLCWFLWAQKLSSSLQNTGSADSQWLKNWEGHFLKS